MTTSEIYWAAGLIEGEGYFAIVPRKAETRPGKGKTKGPPRLIVAVEMKDLEPLERLQNIFGGSVRHRPARNTQHRKRSPMHVWQVTGGRALGIAFTLYSLLSPRRKEQIRTKEALCRFL